MAATSITAVFLNQAGQGLFRQTGRSLGVRLLSTTQGQFVHTSDDLKAEKFNALASQKRSRSSYTPTIAPHLKLGGVTTKKDSSYTIKSETEEAELFHDFKYSLKATPTVAESKRHAPLADLITAEAERPLVLLFGWAGASEKNLDKYAEIYARAGCGTLAYILPTRFIFRSTADVPHLTDRLLKIIEVEGLRDRPILLHNLSDTGLMCYQGLHKTMAERGVKLDIRGSVMDSCPGPRPHMSLARVAALVFVNWTCSLRDGATMSQAVSDSYRLLLERGWPNYLRSLKGLPVELSEIDDKWSGHFLKDQVRNPWPELFLYSKKDFYVDWRYLENEVIKRRHENVASNRIMTKRWDKSGHVAHLKSHKAEYTDTIFKFLEHAYFYNLKRD